MVEHLTPIWIIGIIAIYFLILVGFSYFTGKNADNASFFLAGRRSPWYLVAFGMIGASLSGVTFISVPGWVGSSQFSYFQMVLGYVAGYAIISFILMPVYYKLNLISIYSYLEKRFGFYAYKTGAAFFLLSRTIGSAFRLYLVAIVFDVFVMQHYGVPMWATVFVTIALIWIYTFRGGIKTIVWTDTFQTATMLLAVVFTIIFIGKALQLDFGGMVQAVRNSEYSKTFFFDHFLSDKRHFIKQFLAGASIAVVMTGLDQDMMQKNLSCRNLREAQMNMMTFSVVQVFVNLLFLSLGALLYIYTTTVGLEQPASTDYLYPTVALQHLDPVVGILFVLGLVAAAYSSADSAMTALTTSFCVDFLDFEKKWAPSREEELQKTRRMVHIGVSVVMFLVIMAFAAINNDAVIKQIFTFAGYTYGPLLGLFAFGLATKFHLNDRWVPIVCIASPFITFLLSNFSKSIFFGYEFGFELLLLNGLLTFLGLFAISYYDHFAHGDGGSGTEK
jgi:Na+/proline symporter